MGGPGGPGGPPPGYGGESEQPDLMLDGPS